MSVPADPGASADEDGSAERPETPGAIDYVEAVLELVEAIPAGRVMTYGTIAEIISDDHRIRTGAPRGGPRQVGTVLARHGGGVPWWRVVAASGLPPVHKRAQALSMLTAEGVPFTATGDRVSVRRAVWWPGA